MSKIILNKWKRDMMLLLEVKFPSASKSRLTEILNNIIQNNIKKQEIILHNSYTNNSFETDSLDLTEFYFKKKPLTGGSGVLFDPDVVNPAIPMLKKQKVTRNKYKEEMYSHREGSFGFMMGNLKQVNEKVKMNAWYGINGTRSSMFFNIHCATGITGKGKQLISTATCAFEAFLGDNFAFLDMEDCLMFIKNVISEKDDRVYKDYIVLDDDIGRETLLIRLRETMDNEYDFNEDLVRSLLYGLKKEDINRIYYKNNLTGFCSNSMISELWKDVVLNTENYRNPEPKKTPPEIKGDLDILWEYIKEYVFYNYEFKEKFYRVQTRQRKVVLVIDTDSNMIYLDRWVDFIKETVLTQDELYEKESISENFDFDIVYSLCYLIGFMIKDVLMKYLDQCNVKKENADLIDMKNEYLFSRMVITNGKKAYASVIEYKEGKNMHGKIDVKGLQIHKSDTNRNASKIFQSILEDDILKAENIQVNKILVKIAEFEKEIKRSILNGESTYLKPASVKSEKAYDDPLGEQGIRAVMNYNLAYPDKKIVLPNDFYIIKTTLLKPNQLDKMIDRDIADRFDKEIFQSDIKRIKVKGLYVIAIPKDEEVPEWLIPFIDVKTMTEDIIKAFLPVLKALGVSIVSSNASTSEVSNYISL